MSGSRVHSGAAGPSPRRTVARQLERLADLGARPEDSRDERLRQGTLIFVSVLIALIATIWVLTYFAYGDPVSAAIPGVYQVITVVGLVVLARTRRFGTFRTTQLAAFLVLPALLQLSLGGFVASSGMILWAMVTPLAALALLGLGRSVPWLAAYLVELVLLAVPDARLPYSPAALPAGFVVTFLVLNIAGVTVSAYVMLGYFVEQRDRAHRELQVERERSERLLLNVLPEPIAERLKAEPGVIAEHYEAASVLFADIVGFTARSAVMEAAEVVALLDQVFSAFDRLADAAGVEKIKTIGDAYMLVGGLPEPRPDHLAAVARAALAMREEIVRIAARPGQGWLAVRIGIDSGPVVAGVIGRRKFIYDLWGDTVNTASRMESYGQPGEIQVTGRAAAALGPEFAVRPRGTIEVKGKGPMETYLLDWADQAAEEMPPGPYHREAGMTPGERFDELVGEFLDMPGVTLPGPGRGFGSSALRVEKKIFAMLAQERLVVKLPAARVDVLVTAGEGVRFDANKGVPMKEWFSVDPDSALPWQELASEAFAFVSGE